MVDFGATWRKKAAVSRIFAEEKGGRLGVLNPYKKFQKSMYKYFFAGGHSDYNGK